MFCKLRCKIKDNSAYICREFLLFTIKFCKEIAVAFDFVRPNSYITKIACSKLQAYPCFVMILYHLFEMAEISR